MSRYDGLIIPRSYSEYINKTDAATLAQALQLAGVMDNAPTDGSVNPVKSGGIYNALAGKQDLLTFDNTPTKNSNNPVKSDGIYRALNYTFTHYVNGFTGIYKISIPFSNNNNTIPVGAIIINAREGNTYLLNFYAFGYTNATPPAPNCVNVYQFPGVRYANSVMEQIVKWDVDSTNWRINIYLKKGSGVNSRIVMKLLNLYMPPDYTENITITANTDTTEWDNAPYSAAFNVIQ